MLYTLNALWFYLSIVTIKLEKKVENKVLWKSMIYYYINLWYINKHPILVLDGDPQAPKTLSYPKIMFSDANLNLVYQRPRVFCTFLLSMEGREEFILKF